MPPLLAAPIAEGRTADVYAWGEGTVLKLYREWTPRRWVDEELRVARLVHAAGLAAPAPVEIVEVNGRAGIVYERLDGPSMLVAMQRRWFVTAPQAARQMAELHAAMHACHAATLPRYVERLRRDIEQAPALSGDMRAAVLHHLDSLPDADALCHGDFHPGNILLTARGPVPIDWMTASRGHPLADVARSLMLLTIGAPPGALARAIFHAISSRFARLYLDRYFTHRPAERPLLAAWQPVIAAARLNERVGGEQERLLALIASGLPAAA